MAEIVELVAEKTVARAVNVMVIKEDGVAKETYNFSGEVLRFERKPENKTVVHSVFYRESPDHQ